VNDVCPFCQRIDAGQYDWPLGDYEVVSFEPLAPVTPGHRLFLPRQHVRDATVNNTLTKMTFGQAAAYGAEQHEDFNLIASVGPAATQTIGHLHVHYVPRRPDDGLRLPWTD
jgi:diadenosine tetraphosphate (Ap4A) HIT family hydrolase